MAAATLRYAIVGAGMSGILAGIKLLERGERDLVIYEKDARIGGTWRDNRYPGLTCDVPAHAYTYSFAPHPEWSAYYATGAEIFAYFESVVDRHGLRPWIRTGREVTECRYDAGARRWRLRLGDGGEDVADVVIAASGVLHHPNVPQLPGTESFRGRLFHSARWEDSAPIDAARIGIIGGGSTGTQLVTALGPRALQVVQFLRSPQWIMPVPYFTYSEAERAAFRRDPKLIDAIRFDPQYWANIYRFNAALVEPDSQPMLEIEAIVRKHLEDSVRDPALRERLRPNYRAACKRLIYSWSYYDAVQRPNVAIENAAIDRLTPTGLVTRAGREHTLDTIVLATGFRADRFIRPTRVTGVGGASLDEAWQRRPSAYYAISVPRFPNLFFLNGPTAPVGNFSLIDIAERQWTYIDGLLEELRSGRARAVCAMQSAFEDYEQRRIAAARRTIFGTGCTSWYLDSEGVPMSWPWGYEAFAEAMRAPRLHDYELDAAA